MLDKIGSAMTTSDDKERHNLLQEGEALLAERSKRIVSLINMIGILLIVISQTH